MLLNKKKSNPNTGYPVENYRNPIMVWLLSISFYHPKVNIKNCNKIVKKGNMKSVFKNTMIWNIIALDSYI